MLRTLTYRILSATDGQTILHYLKSLGYSGPILVHLKKTDHGTLLNGVWAHMNETLHTGDLLCLHLEENTSGTSIFPQQIPLAICYEDEDLLVIDKPAGMPVHPSAAHQRDTLANAVTGYYRAKGEIRPFRCINRLDADTSGLIIVAKNMLSAALLGKAMQQRMIRREYLAVVCGTLTGSGTVHAPIARVKPAMSAGRLIFSAGMMPSRTIKVSYATPPIPCSPFIWKRGARTRSVSTCPRSAILWQATSSIIRHFQTQK